ncbi:hypothetical protein [Planobacterium oryzisoli]|uniref:YtxH domain-containing protein n=1 Tax=Planobacterium oryzisoli TaxID=2771435 RepID=A0A930YUG3_9FLAO|nr:hypothetical protein [Planobacterium oryzisoli]MBF5026476.1 hypothetical protein [Planobacterium oryzisoli]
MDNRDYNRAENAVNEAKWTVNEYADRAKDYIRESRRNNQEPTMEGWYERAKANVSEAWEDTKDAVSNAWENTKDFADDAWDNTKDAAHDASNATRDAAEDVKTEWKKSTN